jgi:type III secretion protein U
VAGRDDETDRTEAPTRRRLREARRDGEVAKSKELTSTVGLLAWVVLLAAAVPLAYGELAALFAAALGSVARPSLDAVARVGEASVRALVAVALPALAAAGIAGLATELAQVGGLFAPKRVRPDARRLDPVAGLKRMFAQENAVELGKAVVKTAAVLGIVIAVAGTQLGTALRLPAATPAAVGAVAQHVALLATGSVVAAFLGLAILDGLYQRHAFRRRLRMNRREVRREAREDEGDPHLKTRRRQLHQDWATRNVVAAVQSASVVVTNPTHVAVALRYDPIETGVPIVTAKGEDHVAQLIRAAAEQAGVPVLQHVELARGLNARVEVDDFVPVEFFEAVAEVLRWAAAVRGA